MRIGGVARCAWFACAAGVALAALVAFALPATGRLALATAPGWGEQEAPLPRRYDLRHEVARFDLPHRLDEVSGLAFTVDGRLFAHQDESGMLYAIDPEDGDVDHGFAIGSAARPMRDDFEGLVVVGERWFLVSSRGVLYEFRAAAEGEASPVRVTDTGLGRGCEVEGLAYDAAAESLLFACKTVAPRSDEIRIHRLPLDPDAPAPPPLRVPFRRFEPFGLDDGVHPSGIDVDPATGSLVLVAAREEALIELSPGGQVLSVYDLGHGRHPQAEGVAFGPDGRLYIADERGGRRAHLTVYGPPTERAEGPKGEEGEPWDGA